MLDPCQLALPVSRFFSQNTLRLLLYKFRMQAQNLIGQKLSDPGSLHVLTELLQRNPDHTLCGYAREVCEQFGFFDPKGRPQRSSCLVALRRLEDKGLIALPAPRHAQGGVVKPVRLGEAVKPPLGVPAQVNQIRELSLELVEDEDQRAIWHELMIREHPLGNRPIVGRILRYLVRSEHGYLGALGFSSSAVTLAPRDRWIGWDNPLRAKHLDRVVSLSRFLIRPCVNCQHLASKVLGMVVKRMPGDYLERYGVEVLLLESFVDPHLYRGTCFRAANWIGVGQTQGRGRQVNAQHAVVGVKDIYLYPLDRRFRRKLGVQEYVTPLALSDDLGSEDWALREFGGAQLGNASRVKRVIRIAEAKMKKPDATWLEVADGERHRLKAIYRLIEKPDTSAVTMEGILKGHREMTLRRMAAQEVALLVHDSTDLNFSEKLLCRGLGHIGANQTKTQTNGLRLHSSLALTVEGIPLGVLRAECQAPKSLSEEEKGRDGRSVPIEEKESYRWVQSVQSSIDASKLMPKTMIVNIMDREGDMYAVFDQVRDEPRVHLLVRAEHNRRMEEGAKLFEQVRATKEQGVFEVTVPRQSARRKKGDRQAQERQPSRKAKIAIRYMHFNLLPPAYGLSAKKKPLPVWIIHVKEKGAPKGVNPIEWYLLTTIPVDSIETAQKLAGWYGKRWRIEDWHRVLKSGCKIEKYAHQSAERIKRAIAIDLVVGYRLLMMALLGRELPAEVLFSDLEITVLQKWSEKKSPETVSATTNRLTTIGACIGVLARMGGYLGRKTDPPVGPTILRRAYNRLQNMCEALEMFGKESRSEQKMGYG